MSSVFKLMPKPRTYLLKWNLVSPRHALPCARRGISDVATKTAVRPRVFPTDGFALLLNEVAYEEERLPGYKAEKFYPVHLGEVFRSRYQVVAKLGYGMASTVWLCRDLQEDVLRTLKVCVIGEDTSQEIAISRHLRSIDIKHAGREYVRVALDDFVAEGPHGFHQCLLFPALGMTLKHLRNFFGEGGYEKILLQSHLFILVYALDFMHRAGVVHTDLSPNNILVGASDAKILKVEQAELAELSPRKKLQDRTIHLSYEMPTSWDSPVITDFGAARLGEPGQKHTGDVMPGVFRAPEVIAGMEWDFRIDIWSVGVLIWNLLEDGNLFLPFKDNYLNDELHFAQMVSLMGNPPKQFLERSHQCARYWDAQDSDMASRRRLPEDRASTAELAEDESIVQFMANAKPET